MATVEVEVPDELIRTLEAAVCRVRPGSARCTGARRRAVTRMGACRWQGGHLAGMSRISLWQLLSTADIRSSATTESDFEADRPSRSPHFGSQNPAHEESRLEHDSV